MLQLPLLQGPRAARQLPGPAVRGSTRRTKAPLAAVAVAVLPNHNYDHYVADGTISKDEAAAFSPEQLDFLIRKRLPPLSSSNSAPASAAAAVAAPVQSSGSAMDRISRYVAEGLVTKDEADSFSPEQLEFLIRKRNSPSPMPKLSHTPVNRASSAADLSHSVKVNGAASAADLVHHAVNGAVFKPADPKSVIKHEVKTRQVLPDPRPIKVERSGVDRPAAGQAAAEGSKASPQQSVTVGSLIAAEQVQPKTDSSWATMTVVALGTVGLAAALYFGSGDSEKGASKPQAPAAPVAAKPAAASKAAVANSEQRAAAAVQQQAPAVSAAAVVPPPPAKAEPSSSLPSAAAPSGSLPASPGYKCICLPIEEGSE